VTNRIQFGKQEDVRKLYKLRHQRGENPGGPTRTARKLIANRRVVSAILARIASERTCSVA